MPLFIDPCNGSRFIPAPSLPAGYLDLCIFYHRNPQRPVLRKICNLSLGFHGHHVEYHQHIHQRYISWHHWFSSITNFVIDDRLLNFARVLGFEARDGAFVQTPGSYQRIGYTKGFMLSGIINLPIIIKSYSTQPQEMSSAVYNVSSLGSEQTARGNILSPDQLRASGDVSLENNLNLWSIDIDEQFFPMTMVCALMFQSAVLKFDIIIR